MSKTDLIKLRKQSAEANAIMSNFASRRRIHKDLPVDIGRLFYAFVNKGMRFSRERFDAVFQELENLGYGIVLKNKNARFLQQFVPDTSIKAIGIDSIEPIPAVLAKDMATIKVSNHNKVLVVVIKDGKTFKTFLDEREVDDFSKIIA